MPNILCLMTNNTKKTILFSDQNQFDGYRSRSEWRKKTEGAWGAVLGGGGGGGGRKIKIIVPIVLF